MSIKKGSLVIKDFSNINDNVLLKTISDKLNGGPKRTKITMYNHDTGEIIGEYHNKVVVTGGILNAINVFGCSTPVNLPNYNEEMALDNTDDYDKVTAKNKPVVCLFCVGDSGCGTTAKDVFVASYKDRIAPENDILPFRYVSKSDDLNDDLRAQYFGRKTLGVGVDDKIAYYFKKLDTEPQLHIEFTDGTEISDNLYSINSDQDISCYVETRLRISRLDFRDYFDQVTGWEKARISTISLCYAWYDDTIDNKYRYYQQILPYTKLNFPFENLNDLTKAIDFNYQVYF